ncbi:Exonuclease SbcC [Clostridiaceae bacterium JG1575]|nr:Exonuclease SbcC [Clostridiaceae bacterium JG1575]
MIPLRLEMEGFLTFREPTRIDFQALNEEGLFLISGPTGSGKTSIFDAITYALYGVATTSVRNAASDLRSHLIAPEGTMRVFFEFRSGEHLYALTRWQTGQRPIKQQLIIDGDDAHPLTKVGEIKEKMAEVLGLTADQFCQIVLLPQGEFRNFLGASSKEKSEILRKLFATGPYAKVRDRVHELFGNADAKVKEAKTIIDSQKKGSLVAREEDAPETILALMEEERQREEGLRSVKAQEREALIKRKERLSQDLVQSLKQEKDQKALENLMADLQRLEAEEGVFLEALEKADLLRSLAAVVVLYDQLQAARSKKKELLELQEQLSNRHQATKEQWAESLVRSKTWDDQARHREEMLAAIKKKEATLEDLTLLAQEQQQEQREAATVSTLSQQLKKEEAAREEREALLHQERAQQQKSLKVQERYEALREAYRECEALLERLTKRDQLREALQQEDVQQTNQSEELIEAQRIQEAAKKTLTTLKKEWEMSGLAPFSQALVPGAPCPLCGSTHHPMPYELPKELTSEGMAKAQQLFDAAQEGVRRLEEALRFSKKEAARLRAELEGQRERLGKQDQDRDKEPLIQELKRLEEEGRAAAQEKKTLALEAETLKKRLVLLERTLSEFTDTSQALRSALELLFATRSRIQEAKKRAGDASWQSLTQSLQTLRKEEQALQKIIRQEQEMHRSLSEQMAREEEQLKSRKEQEEELLSLLAELSQRFSSALSKKELTLDAFLFLKKDLAQEASLRKSAQDFMERLKRTRTQCEVQKEALSQSPAWDSEAIREEIEEVQQKLSAAQEAYDAANGRLSRLDSCLLEIRPATADFLYWSAQREVAHNLDYTCSRGTTFENYVLSYYLDGVLLLANERLKAMSAGRYHLIRQEVGQDGRRKIEGLELNVFDAYSNTQRDVRTLSGGESFKAAMAMALGLSDFIQETRAGMRLETIFIDEGFGTLDQESLDIAMETILDIQGQGRLVGIISHVEELKERIPAKIMVENRGAQGSFLSIQGIAP